MCSLKMTVFECEKERLLGEVKEALRKNEQIEIDFYSQHFEYNGESLEEVEKIFDRWKENKVLYKMQYDRMEIQKYNELMTKLTEEFILKENQNNEEVLEFLYQMHRIQNKFKDRFAGAIRPNTNAIAAKLRDLGYTYSYDKEELKKYDRNFEIMAYISDDKEKIENILIGETLESLYRRFLDPKVGKGIEAYNTRFLVEKKREKQKKLSSK